MIEMQGYRDDVRSKRDVGQEAKVVLYQTAVTLSGQYLAFIAFFLHT